MRVRDELNDEGLAAFRAGMAATGATGEQVEAALDAELPEGGAAAATMAFSGHGKVNGSHTHSHPTYGRQGGDRSHEHMHNHAGDGSHAHHESTAARTAAAHSFITATTSTVDGVAVEEAAAATTWLSAQTAEAIVAAAGLNGGSMVAAAMEVLGSPWGVEQRGDEAWTLIGRDGEVGTFETYQLAVGELGALAFVDGGRPVLAETWRSEMCFEDEETPDGRYIAPGALRYREPPLPFMLQTMTDVGHFGAVLAGAVLSVKTSDGTAIGAGEFDDTDAGRAALQIVESRGRFGVSIDGMAPAEAEYECTKRDEETGECVHERIRFNLLTVGGLTGTPFPAFPGAYIALEQRATAASGEPEAEAARARDAEPCADCDEQPAEARPVPLPDHVHAGRADAVPVGKEEPFTAAAGVDLARPPVEWFADPGFAAGDGRTVRQPDGHWACPHTVTADGQVYGHMAGWWSCHTGYVDRCVTAPRSKTGYAAFLLRPLMTADGSIVKVGHLSMGCGHASTADGVSWQVARDHYDGGPGAVRMAQVACGEDEFGIWYAGALDPAATPQQVRAFSACSVSGDWREVWASRGLDLVACLAGVTVPGFPIAAAALAAAGWTPEEVGGLRIGEVAARMVDGRTVALVAAGVVRQPEPWERTVGVLAGRVEALEHRLAQAEAVTDELRGLAAERIAASLGAVTTNGHAPEPAPSG